MPCIELYFNRARLTVATNHRHFTAVHRFFLRPTKKCRCIPIRSRVSQVDAVGDAVAYTNHRRRLPSTLIPSQIGPILIDILLPAIVSFISIMDTFVSGPIRTNHYLLGSYEGLTASVCQVIWELPDPPGRCNAPRPNLRHPHSPRIRGPVTEPGKIHRLELLYARAVIRTIIENIFPAR